MMLELDFIEVHLNFQELVNITSLQALDENHQELNLGLLV